MAKGRPTGSTDAAAAAADDPVLAEEQWRFNCRLHSQHARVRSSTNVHPIIALSLASLFCLTADIYILTFVTERTNMNKHANLITKVSSTYFIIITHENVSFKNFPFNDLIYFVTFFYTCVWAHQICLDISQNVLYSRGNQETR